MISPELKPPAEAEVIELPADILPKLRDHGWFRDGNCYGIEDDSGFYESDRPKGRPRNDETDPQVHPMIVKYCATCIVKESCLADTLRMKETNSVRGGLTIAEVRETAKYAREHEGRIPYETWLKTQSNEPILQLVKPVEVAPVPAVPKQRKPRTLKPKIVELLEKLPAPPLIPPAEVRLVPAAPATELAISELSAPSIRGQIAAKQSMLKTLQSYRDTASPAQMRQLHADIIALNAQLKVKQ